MYNGIGLLTPRGSGTSGYVTANKFNLRRAPVQKDDQRKEGEGPKTQKPNEEILLHKKKREIEVTLFEFRLKLEDEDKLPPEQVEEMLAMERSVLEERFSKEIVEETASKSAQETHEVAKRKMEQMERFRKALGIRSDVKEGEAFDSELQEQRKKETAERRAEMERRRHAKEEKKRHETQDTVEKPRGGGERKKREDRHKSREKRKTRESLEREHASPVREGGRSGALPRGDERTRSRDRHHEVGDAVDSIGRPIERGPPMDVAEGGRNAWSADKGRPYHHQRRYNDEGPPPDYRHNDPERGPPYRGRFYDRGRYSRGRGRRFPGRGFRPYEMSGPGYYRIGEAAPERYDPSGEHGEGHWEAQDRWQKVDLDEEEKEREREKPKPERVEAPHEETTNRVGAYVAEYDAHAALAGKERGKGKMRDRRASPMPRSPDSVKQSPSQPKCYRRAPDYRSASPSPPSIDKEGKKNTAEPHPSRRSASPKPASKSPKDHRKEKSGSERRPRSTSRSPTVKSGSSKKSGKSKDRSSSSSMSSASSRSGRGRRQERSGDRRRNASPRRYYEDRGRYPDHRRGGEGRYGGRWRHFDSYRGGYRGGYRGYRRPGYGYNPHGGYGSWRSDRRHDRRVSRSRSRERRHADVFAEGHVRFPASRRRSRSFSRSSSTPSKDRKRGRSSSSSLSKGRSSGSEKKRRLESKSPTPEKSKP